MPFNSIVRCTGRSLCLLMMLLPLLCFLRPFQEMAQLFCGRRIGSRTSTTGRMQPLYTEAEKLLLAAGDSRSALLARVGRMRGSMETYSFPALSDELAGLLKSSQVQNDPELKLRCLTAKGDVDGEINARLATLEWG